MPTAEEIREVSQALCANLLGILLILSPLGRYAAAFDGATSKASERESFVVARRPPWTNSRVRGTPDPPSPFRTEFAFPRLRFNNPVGITSAPGTDRLFVYEMSGAIWSFPNNPDIAAPDPFGNVPSVLGMAFHPDFERNRFVYICNVAPDGDPKSRERVSRFTVSRTNPPRIDATSEQVVITWRMGGHHGGCLKFGPDGCLYIATGDGDGEFDKFRTGQDVSDLLSSILRIDVDHPDPGREYGIPADNPFVGTQGARGEIWAYGLRNPWKMSFDRETGDLWTGDVGWELWEMVYRIERGGNYGWSVMEGRQPVNPAGERGPTPILPPVMDHDHSEARSITGGFVYRGSQFPELVGAYVYGDYETGKIWALRYDGSQVTWHQELVDTPLRIVGFAEDNAGELYILDLGGESDAEDPGTIHRLVPRRDTGERHPFPRRLSETGLFSSVADEIPADGVIPFSVIAEAWSDRALGNRYLGLVGDSVLEVSAADHWRFPEGAVLARTLSLEMESGNPQSRRRIETQLIHFGAFPGRLEAYRFVGFYTYAWNDAQTDAELVDAGGAERTLAILDPEFPTGRRVQTWRYASRAECSLCHNKQTRYVLGFNELQLDRPCGDDGSARNQLEVLQQMGVFSTPLPESPETHVKLVSPSDPDAGLEARARSYLHVNCGSCHRIGGAGGALFDTRYSHTLEQTRIVHARPRLGGFGLQNARLVAAGDPFRSVIYYRMAKLGTGRMPRAGSIVVDETGLDLMHDWIRQLQKPTNDDTLSADRFQPAVDRLLDSSQTPEGIGEAVDEFTSSTSGALQLLRLIDEGRLAPASARQVLAQVAVDRRSQVRGLFERFLPESERVQTLGSAIDPAEILALSGDSRVGERLFFEDSTFQCRGCHRVGHSGRDVGPDLSGIGKKYDRTALLETILQPSRKIEPKYQAWVLATVQGKVYSGLLVEKTETMVVIKDVRGELIRVATNDVDQLIPQQKSLMPELLLRDMTAQQAADLLEFLCTLKN